MTSLVTTVVLAALALAQPDRLGSSGTIHASDR